MTTEQVIEQTKNWISSFIIKYNICPFAKNEFMHDRIRYSVIKSTNTEHCLQALYTECQYLDTETDIETTLIIFPDHFGQFDEYLDFLSIAETLLLEQNYEGVYQLASFHPDYCFDGENPLDPANYTNRSPYPMLHLLRETSIEAALKSYLKPESIPERNIKLTREMGLEKIQGIFNQALKTEKKPH